MRRTRDEISKEKFLREDKKGCEVMRRIDKIRKEKKKKKKKEAEEKKDGRTEKKGKKKG